MSLYIPAAIDDASRLAVLSVEARRSGHRFCDAVISMTHTLAEIDSGCDGDLEHLRYQLRVARDSASYEGAKYESALGSMRYYGAVEEAMVIVNQIRERLECRGAVAC